MPCATKEPFKSRPSRRMEQESPSIIPYRSQRTRQVRGSPLPVAPRIPVSLGWEHTRLACAVRCLAEQDSGETPKRARGDACAHALRPVREWMRTVPRCGFGQYSSRWPLQESREFRRCSARHFRCRMMNAPVVVVAQCNAAREAAPPSPRNGHAFRLASVSRLSSLCS